MFYCQTACTPRRAPTSNLKGMSWEVAIAAYGALYLPLKRFFDNSLIQEVNRDYGSRLSPGELK
jgi:hypothetical protein